jgi:hypothetical protein
MRVFQRAVSWIADFAMESGKWIRDFGDGKNNFLTIFRRTD